MATREMEWPTPRSTALDGRIVFACPHGVGQVSPALLVYGATLKGEQVSHIVDWVCEDGKHTAIIMQRIDLSD